MRAGMLELPDDTKAALFDMDGVLINSLEYDLSVCSDLLSKYLVKEISIPHFIISKHFALPQKPFWEMLIKDMGEALEQDRFNSLLKEYESGRLAFSYALMPGVYGTLETLQEQGILCAVVSSNDEVLIEAVLERLHIRVFFKVLIGLDSPSPFLKDTALREKPAPDMYLAALELLNVPARDAVVFEDSIVGASAGFAAGVRVYGMSTGGTSYDELTAFFKDKNGEVIRGFAPDAQRIFEGVKSGNDAEELVLLYLNEAFRGQGVKVLSATIDTTSKTALNSVNGTCILSDQREVFFKFHTESGEQTSLANSELYKVSILADAGWNILQPIATSVTPGTQCVLYPRIKSDTVYRLLFAAEKEFLETGNYPAGLEQVTAAIDRSLQSVSALMLASLRPADNDLPQASIHQLFSHRLLPQGDITPRIESFYESNPRYQELKNLRWIINGRAMPWTISELVDDSKYYLAAARSTGMASVISHGDEHFANQFLLDSNILFFDPAFAGRMPALLAPVKATAHNTMPHPFWYYEPDEGAISFTANVEDAQIVIDHNWNIETSSPIRLEIAKMYRERIWKPLLDELSRTGALPQWWRRYVRSALFSSLFLAKNLLDENEYRGDRSLFNLARLLESLLAIGGATVPREP